AILALFAATTTHAQDKPPRPPVVLTDAAIKLHQSTFVFDGHNDLPYACEHLGDRFFTRLDIAKPQPKLHTDIARLRKGNVGAQFWSAYVPAETAKTGTAVKEILDQIDIVHRLVTKYPDTFE